MPRLSPLSAEDYMDWIENRERPCLDVYDLIYGFLALAAALVTAYAAAPSFRR